MRKTRRGQSTAEYAVLFAIVIGAAIAMQQYVGSRLRGAISKQADAYAVAANNATPLLAPGNRTVGSTSTGGTTYNMTGATFGSVHISSNGATNTTITQ